MKELKQVRRRRKQKVGELRNFLALGVHRKPLRWVPLWLQQIGPFNQLIMKIYDQHYKNKVDIIPGVFH